MRGILLGGGQSRRMGRPKQWLPFDGKPLLLHLIETLQAVCDDIVVVVQEEEERRRIEALGLTVCCDVFPGQGPLAGLHAGLQGLMPTENAFLVGCDLPFLQADVLRTLQEELALHPEAQAVVPADGVHLYPVCALYRGQVREIAASCLQRQENALRLFLKHLNVQYVETGRWQEEPLWPFLNMNTPDDYERACNLWQKEGLGKDE